MRAECSNATNASQLLLSHLNLINAGLVTLLFLMAAGAIATISKLIISKVICINNLIMFSQHKKLININKIILIKCNVSKFLSLKFKLKLHLPIWPKFIFKQLLKIPALQNILLISVFEQLRKILVQNV